MMDVMFQAFTWMDSDDGSYWDTLSHRASELVDAGFTAVWLPPCCKGQAGVDDIGYGLYDLYDLGEFDQKGTVRTRWGTREQLEACVKRLNDAGLYTLADIVLNHRMGADATETFLAVMVDPNDRTKVIGETHEFEAWTRFEFPGRGDKYSPFRWRWHHFTAVDTPAHGGEEAQGVYRVYNKSFADDVGGEMGNYDYLMGGNVDLRQDVVRQELFTWGRWFLDATKFQGFRMDAAKHMAAHFTKDFIGHLRHETGKELFMVCEYAIDNRPALSAFISQTEGSVTAFDFPLHFRFAEASSDSQGFDLRSIFTEALATHHPKHAVTFVDNHDSDPAQGGSGWVADWFKPMAYGMILLRKDGYPCVYAGDYDGRQTAEYPLTSHHDVIDTLIKIRRSHAHGDQHDHFDNPRCIAWVRTGDEAHPGALVVICNTADAGEVELPTHRPETRFVNAFDKKLAVTTNADGRAVFSYPAGGMSVWRTGA